MKRLLLICLVLCFWGEYGYAVEKQKDIEILYNRLLEEYLSDSVDVSQAEKDLAVMQTDGSWKDIDYKTVTFYFDAERHLKRLKNMAIYDSSSFAEERVEKRRCDETFFLSG